MSFFYSPTTGGFYQAAIRDQYEASGSWPADGVEITDEKHRELFEAQSQGASIKPGPGGYPIAVCPPPPSVHDIFNEMVDNVRANGGIVARSISKPYSAEEAATWWRQLIEAERWTDNNAYYPIMLSAMVDSSNGGWTLPALAAAIMENAESWAAAAGNIMGQVKARIVALESMRDQVVAGTKTVADLRAVSTTILPPTVNLEDKF